MVKAFWVGVKEKHFIEFRVHWWLGIVTLSSDGKTLFRKPFFFKLEKSVEVGSEERYLIGINFNLFDYFGEVLKLTVNGQNVNATLDPGLLDKRDTPVDDAAAALFFVVVSHLVFSVIGTLFVPDLDSLETRLMLLLGGMIYLWFFVKILAGSKYALWVAVGVFSVDTVVAFFTAPSLSGTVVRGLILYYLIMGIRYQQKVLSRIV